MFGFGRRSAASRSVEALHEVVVAASREPGLYGEGGFPDTVEGRFESLTLHALLLLRRLRQLPAPADELAQELVDALFAHLEIALREIGVGDMGMPKRMKKLAGAFYDRTHRYDAALDARSTEALGRELAQRLDVAPGLVSRVVAEILSTDRDLATRDLAGLLAGSPFRPSREHAAAAS